MQPTVGRMVYYKARGSADGKFPKKDRAAVVTDVRSDVTPSGKENVVFQVRLAVLNPEGLFFSDWLDQGQEGGQWDWMPFQKDQQLRAGYSLGVDPAKEGMDHSVTSPLPNVTT